MEHHPRAWSDKFGTLTIYNQIVTFLRMTTYGPGHSPQHPLCVLIAPDCILSPSFSGRGEKYICQLSGLNSFTIILIFQCEFFTEIFAPTSQMMNWTIRLVHASTTCIKTQPKISTIEYVNS